MNLAQNIPSITTKQKQQLFASFFILQNRLQTAGEKIQTEISMKQWLLLAIVSTLSKPHTLTVIGSVMGCSRQNVKQLALVLERKGFLKLIDGNNNSVQLELTQKAYAYSASMQERHTEALNTLFGQLTAEEVHQLHLYYEKLFTGLHNLEGYASSLVHKNRINNKKTKKLIEDEKR